MPSQLFLLIMAGTISPLPSHAWHPSFLSRRQRKNLALYLEQTCISVPSWISTTSHLNWLAYKEVQTCISRNLPVISKAGLQHFKQLTVQNVSTHRGPAIQPGASGFSQSSGQQDSSSAQSVPSTSEADSTTEKQEGRAGFKCAECGVVKYRKPDFEGHMWSKHRLGDPIVCNRGTYGRKSYSSASSLRQHIRTIHQRQYKFKCQRCDYGTDNYDCLTSHRVKKHKEKITTPKGKLIVYTCKKCKKAFDAPHLLRKHKTNESCTRKKTIPCPDCTRFYKTKEGLAYHQEQQHKGKKSPCSTCGKMVSEKAMPNHQKQYSSERAVQRAKDFVAKAQRRKRAFTISSLQLAKRKIEWCFKVYPCKDPKVSKREENISNRQQGSELFIFFSENFMKTFIFAVNT